MSSASRFAPPPDSPSLAFSSFSLPSRPSSCGDAAHRLLPASWWHSQLMTESLSGGASALPPPPPPELLSAADCISLSGLFTHPLLVAGACERAKGQGSGRRYGSTQTFVELLFLFLGFKPSMREHVEMHGRVPRAPRFSSSSVTGTTNTAEDVRVNPTLPRKLTHLNADAGHPSPA
ncbi:hypothetical protein EYF80_043970 [Liparis tanakae]|uniref:Uncharacterized protein n=1 Tax=Liparis tanakae TaxID=230148 RepID=A0A4Z2FY76_9TELE|nr:hypothetical protein EYF80_043970 [Liparis tanakae]